MSQERFQTSVVQSLLTHAEKGKVRTHGLLAFIPTHRSMRAHCRRQRCAYLRVNYSRGAVIYVCWFTTNMQVKIQVQVSRAERNNRGEDESLSCLQASICLCSELCMFIPCLALHRVLCQCFYYEEGFSGL